MVILPSIKPLDTVVELAEEPRRRCGELLGDLAEMPTSQPYLTQRMKMIAPMRERCIRTWAPAEKGMSQNGARSAENDRCHADLPRGDRVRPSPEVR